MLRLVILSEIFIFHSATAQEVPYENFHYSERSKSRVEYENECRRDYEKDRY